jgi:hypothetical protein
VEVNGGGEGVREMLAAAVRGFVEDPAAVEVHEVERSQTTVYELRVAPGDLGRVIGREGRTARALRALLAAAGEKLQRRFVLQILE